MLISALMEYGNSFMKQLLSIGRATSALQRKRKKCIGKFLYYFPGGYASKKFVAWERDYKWKAHLTWNEKLNKDEFSQLLKKGEFVEIAKRASSMESKTNLLFSFEKMALRDGIKTEKTSELFAEGLFSYVYGEAGLQQRFELFRETLSSLPVRQTRVLTWPLQTVFGFIADPWQHIFLKPTVTKRAAEKYQFDFKYQSRVNWATYQSLLEFAELIKADTVKWKPKDLIDIQSFIWVLGSEEYPD
jgi:hypothetical protein